jgi:hypothetical protein
LVLGFAFDAVYLGIEEGNEVAGEPITYLLHDVKRLIFVNVVKV